MPNSKTCPIFSQKRQFRIGILLWANRIIAHLGHSYSAWISFPYCRVSKESVALVSKH